VPVLAPHFEKGPAFVGLCHDFPIGVTEAGSFTSWPDTARRSAAGFAPEPSELGEAIHRAIEAVPGRRVVVAAHGVATDDDDWRDTLLERTMEVVGDAANAGLAGYFHDSAIDGYEWVFGFNAPRGLIRRDRTIKPSAHHLHPA